MISSTDLSGLRIARESRGPARIKPGRAMRLGLIALAAVVTAVAVLVVLGRERALEVRTATAVLRGGAGGAGGLTANGYVVARTKASVSSKVPGRLAFLGVEEGDRTTAGAVIARLEAAEYEAIARQASSEVLASEANQLEAVAEVTRATRALARATSLRADSLISEQAVEDAATAVEVAEARLRVASARTNAARQGHAAALAALDNTVIRAPFSGTILRKDAEVGEVVAPAVAGGGLTRGAVVTMADLSTLEVEVDVNEAYIANIRPNQSADVVLDAYPGQNFAGHVRQIVPTADRQKATILVRVAIDSKDVRIVPEMGARVIFREAEDTPDGASIPARVYVPAAAVRESGGLTAVWLVVDGRARRQDIDAGPVMGEEREVRRGLAGGEVVILDAPDGITDGARLKTASNTP
jgi:RND family efflux transporter MFP subunit